MTEQYLGDKQDQIASGLDMAPTIQFYEENAKAFFHKIPERGESLSFDVEVRGQEHIHLTGDQLQGLLSLFPASSQERSILKSITGLPSQWFHRDSLGGRPQPTTNIAEAISPTAIIPSYVYYDKSKNGNGFDAHIQLFEIPGDIVSDEVRSVIHAQGLVHEIGHSIVAPAVYGDPVMVRTSEGLEMDVYDIFMQFAKIAENFSPVSHYSSAYRDADNKFKRDKDDSNVLLTAISEEMVESMTARLLNFVSTNDESRVLDPFHDRPEIEKLIDQFLYSVKV